MDEDLSTMASTSCGFDGLFVDTTIMINAWTEA